MRWPRSAWQPSVQWRPTQKPRKICAKRYDKRRRKWMRRSCHYRERRERRRLRRITTTTTTTTTTTRKPVLVEKPRYKRCFKRYNKKHKKYITRCTYWD